MPYKLLFIVLFLGISVLALENTEVVLNWQGGHCQVCDKDYACSSGYGNWNAGKRFFIDPVGQGKVVRRIDFNAYSVWGCNGPTADIRIKLNGFTVDQQILNGGCSCSSCDVLGTFTLLENGQCLNYYFNDTNEVQVEVMNSGLICLAKVVVNIFYEDQVDPPCIIDHPSICAGFGGCGQGVCTFDDNTDYKPYCQCPEEYYGPNCQCFIPSQDLQTDYPPVLTYGNSGFISKDQLFITVQNSVKYFDTKITFLNSTNECQQEYPSDGVVWTKTFDEDLCVYNLQVIIPWSVAWPNCLFKRIENDYVVYFIGELIIENKEDLGIISPERPEHLIRTLTTSLPFMVIFQKQVYIYDGGIVIFSPVDITGHIIKQEYIADDPTPGVSILGTAYVKLLTTVQHPFKIVDPMSLTGSGQGILSVNEDTADPMSRCLNDGQLCKQVWNIEIQLVEYQCFLDGEYHFNFHVDCQEELSDCLLDDSDTSASITFTLQSGYLCPQVIDYIWAFGYINVFDDVTHLVPNRGFFLGETIFMVTHVEAIRKSLSHVEINGITVYQPYADFIGTDLMLGGVNTPEGDLVELQLGLTHDPMVNDIQLVLNPKLFKAPIGGYAFILFVVNINVTFDNTGPRTRTLISRYSFNSNSLEAKADVRLFSESTSSANSICFSTIAFLCLMAYYLI